MVKTRVEINKMEKKCNKKVNKSQIFGSLKRPLKLIKKKKTSKKNNCGGGVSQISNIRNKNENITMDPTDV